MWNFTNLKSCLYADGWAQISMSNISFTSVAEWTQARIQNLIETYPVYNNKERLNLKWVVKIHIDMMVGCVPKLLTMIINAVLHIQYQVFDLFYHFSCPDMMVTDSSILVCHMASTLQGCTLSRWESQTGHVSTYCFP